MSISDALAKLGDEPSEIPEEAKRLATEAVRNRMLESGDFAAAAEEAILAALPHLRVQETPAGLREALEEALATVETGIARSTKPDREGFLTTSRIRWMLANHPAPHPRPVVDREAINHALNLHWWDEDEHPCACGFDFIAVGQSFKMHLADIIAALLPTEEGEGS